MLNVFQPNLGAAEISALTQVVESNWIGRGKVTDRFEAEWARHVQTSAKRVVSTTSATEGLFQVMALTVEPGEEVVMPAISFVGAANAVLSAGGRLAFCDVDERSLNPSLRNIKAAVTRKTTAVVVLHYGGVPCLDIEEIAEYCDDNNLLLIEDSAISPASTINGKSCGTIGDFGVWSFDAMKILSTGDGGMIYSNYDQDMKDLRLSMGLGMDQSSGMSSAGRTPRWWEFDVLAVGRLARMNDMTASVGLVQLERLPRFIARRRYIYDVYRQAFANEGWLAIPPTIPDNVESSYYAFWIQTDRRDELADYLLKKDIYTTFRYHPLHRLSIYGPQPILKSAERAASRTLWLPLHQSLSDRDVEYVIDCVRGFN